MIELAASVDPSGRSAIGVAGCVKTEEDGEETWCKPFALLFPHRERRSILGNGRRTSTMGPGHRDCLAFTLRPEALWMTKGPSTRGTGVTASPKRPILIYFALVASLHGAFHAEIDVFILLHASGHPRREVPWSWQARLPGRDLHRELRGLGASLTGGKVLRGW